MKKSQPVRNTYKFKKKILFKVEELDKVPQGQVTDMLMLMVGAICLLAGLTLAIWTIRLFQNKGKGTLAPWDATRHLITSGPYAYIRNPMITGIFLILTGEACLLGSYAIGIWTVLFLVINLIYFPLSEEPGLRARFGKEYDTYCQNVPRYIPRLTPWKRRESFGTGTLIHSNEAQSEIM